MEIKPEMEIKPDLAGQDSLWLSFLAFLFFLSSDEEFQKEHHLGLLQSGLFT